MNNDGVVEPTDITEHLFAEFAAAIKSRGESLESLKAKADKSFRAFSDHRASTDPSDRQALSRDYLTHIGELLQLVIVNLIGGPLRIEKNALTELSRLRIVLSHLARGEQYALVYDAVGSGDLREEPLVTFAKATAVAYVGAARDKRIYDRSPNKTVCEAFGVNRKTVQEWCRDDDLCAASAALYAGEVQGINEELRQAGARYRVLTTTQKMRRYELERAGKS